MTLTQDLLSGAEAIGEFLNIPVRRVYTFAKREDVPVFAVGGVLYARRSELEARFTGGWRSE